ncbi:hypothetical protein KPH14_000832 [Odynerus spinipes]|uniref:DDE-1 domain-containing protein n=1 Tax=Odynerus spinipes TaxID=1348599 RepID=A0AAD9VI32_9HYME|nr:hypothetical protein KPH14_000832 [Odynerus spinipes]
MRNYKRKTERGKKSQGVYELAALEVMEKSVSIRKAAETFQLCHVSLSRYIKKKKNGETLSVGYIQPRLVFTPAQEDKMAKYLLQCANIYFGLLPTEVRKLAYQCAVFLNAKNIPPSWHENQIAGIDWFTKFLKRNRSLSIRTPEATSLSRATSFNRTNVVNFFNKYERLLQTYKFTASRIWNIDETGATTVQTPKKIVAARGQKQVGAITSAERGTLVTLACAVNAAGIFIPPVFVFPRMHYTNFFLRGGPPDSIGTGNFSGWMTEKEFSMFMDHFIKHAKPTEQDPVLLLLENHSSHINIEVVTKAKENHVTMLSFPPHCSHNLQLLDVGVYGPFKNYLSRCQTAWMSSNPGKTMKIYDIPGIVKDSLPLALNPANIMSGFRASGIWPYNPNIFQDVDFAPSYVTDRPNPNEREDTPSDPGSLNIQEPSPGPSNASNELIGASRFINVQTIEQIQLQPDTQTESSCSSIYSNIQEHPISPTPGSSKVLTDSTNFSPSKIRPYPKALPRKQTIQNRRKRKSAVLTDTPEKEALEKEYEEKILKKEKQTIKEKKSKKQ